MRNKSRKYNKIVIFGYVGYEFFRGVIDMKEDKKVEKNSIGTVNLNLYKTFYDVVRYKSLSRASKNTLISQPAISKSIKRLEEELNVKLFYRTINGMILTERGKELSKYVEEAYNNIIVAQRRMQESNDLNFGKLIIGVPSHIASFYLFDRIKKFHEEYPNVEVSIVSRPSTELMSRLEKHELDFVVDTSPINTEHKDIEVVKLYTERFCLASLKCLNLSKKIKNLKDLENYTFILPAEKSTSVQKLKELFLENNIELRSKICIETSEMIRECILQNFGIGYVLECVIKKDVQNKTVEILNLIEGLPTVDINLVYSNMYLTSVPKYFINNYLQTTHD